MLENIIIFVCCFICAIVLMFMFYTLQTYKLYKSCDWFYYEDSIVEYSTLSNLWFKDTGFNPYHAYMYDRFKVKSFKPFFIYYCKIYYQNYLK